MQPLVDTRPLSSSVQASAERAGNPLQRLSRVITGVVRLHLAAPACRDDARMSQRLAQLLADLLQLLAPEQQSAGPERLLQQLQLAGRAGALSVTHPMLIALAGTQLAQVLQKHFGPGSAACSPRQPGGGQERRPPKRRLRGAAAVRQGPRRAGLLFADWSRSGRM